MEQHFPGFLYTQISGIYVLLGISIPFDFCPQIFSWIVELLPAQMPSEFL